MWCWSSSGRMAQLARYCSWLAGGLFLWAGTVKVVHPGLFYGDILSYQLVPDSLAVVAAWYLPWFECVCGAALFCGKTRPAARLGLLVLVAVFALALVSAWVRGLDISCGCFGSSGLRNRYGWWLLRDAGIALLLWWSEPARRSG